MAPKFPVHYMFLFQRIQFTHQALSCLTLLGGGGQMTSSILFKEDFKALFSK